VCRGRRSIADVTWRTGGPSRGAETGAALRVLVEVEDEA